MEVIFPRASGKFCRVGEREFTEDEFEEYLKQFESVELNLAFVDYNTFLRKMKFTDNIESIFLVLEPEFFQSSVHTVGMVSVPYIPFKYILSVGFRHLCCEDSIHLGDSEDSCFPSFVLQVTRVKE